MQHGGAQAIVQEIVPTYGEGLVLKPVRDLCPGNHHHGVTQQPAADANLDVFHPVAAHWFEAADGLKELAGHGHASAAGHRDCVWLIALAGQPRDAQLAVVDRQAKGRGRRAFDAADLRRDDADARFAQFVQQALEPPRARKAVRIHGDEHRRGGFGSAEVTRVRYAAAHWEIFEAHVFEGRRIDAKKITTGVGRAVIDDNDLVGGGDGIANGRKSLAQARAFVVRRQDNGYFSRHSFGRVASVRVEMEQAEPDWAESTRTAQGRLCVTRSFGALTVGLPPFLSVFVDMESFA